MESTIFITSSGGGFVNEETVIAKIKFSNIPKKPMPSGDIPNNQ